MIMQDKMAKYNIGYLDEEELWQAIAINKLGSEFNVTVVDFPISLDKIWQFIIDNYIDAIIVDFRLYGSGQVSYTGADVVSEIMKHNKYFHIFIMTAFEKDAIDKSENVLIINGKGVLSEDKGKDALDNFILVLKHVIKSYKDRMENAKATILELHRKSLSGQTLSPEEDEALFHAELFLNETDKDNALPSNLNSIGYSCQLKEIIRKTDNLISELKNR